MFYNDAGSKVPLHLQHKADLISKGQSAGQSHDEMSYAPERALAIPVQSVAQSSYRTPHDRESGHVVFRRYVEGDLDIDYAVDKVVDAIHITQDTTHHAVAPMDMMVLRDCPSTAQHQLLAAKSRIAELTTLHLVLAAG